MELAEKRINAILLLFCFILLCFIVLNGRMAARLEKKQQQIDQHDPLYSLPD